jgi:hypothetical protein
MSNCYIFFFYITIAHCVLIGANSSRPFLQRYLGRLRHLLLPLGTQGVKNKPFSPPQALPLALLLPFQFAQEFGDPLKLHPEPALRLGLLVLPLLVSRALRVRRFVPLPGRRQFWREPRCIHLAHLLARGL